MSYSNELDQLEDAVQRLRELHGDAADADQKHPALLLGLAVADLVTSLPESDSRRPQLAAEGLARLEESGATTDSAATARQRLRRASPGQPSEVFQPGHGNLSWDVDWEALSGPTQAARQLQAMMPMLAGAVPGASPVWQALTAFEGAFRPTEPGQGSTDADAALTDATRQLEAVGLSQEKLAILRMISMWARVTRCGQTEQAGGQPDWPTLAELDAVIAGAEAADPDELLNFGPFKELSGLPHVWIAGLITARLQIEFKTRTNPRDLAWRDDTLRLLDRADDHLRQAPPAFDGLTRQLRSTLAQPRATLAEMTPSSAPAPTPAEPSPPPPPPPPKPKRPEPEPATVVEDQLTASPQFDGLFDLVTNPDGRAALRVFAQASETNVFVSLGHMMGIVDAVFAGRWTSEAEKALTGLEQHIQRLGADDGSSLTERAVATAMLAQTRLSKRSLLSANPRLDERPPRSEALALADEMEAALELLDEAAAEASSDSIFSDLRNMMHASVGVLLTELRETEDGQLDEGRIQRAREHLDQVPPEFLSQQPASLADVIRLQRLFGEGRQATPEENAILASRFGEVFETTGPTLASAVAAVTKAKQDSSAESIDAALNELNQVGIALPAGSPLHFRRLTLLAEVQTMLASRSTEPFAAYDAIGTAIEALRTAKVPLEHRLASLLLVAMLALIATKGLRDGPFEESEELFSAVLANASPEDWPLRVITTVGLAAAKCLCASATDDRLLQEASAQLIAEARQLLPPPVMTTDWHGAARALFTWTAARGIYGADPVAAATALDIGEVIHDLLADRADEEQFATELKMHREAREQLLAVINPESDGSPAAETASPPTPPSQDAQEQARLARHLVAEATATLNRELPDGLPRRPLSGLSEAETTSLQNAITELHAVSEGFFQDASLRRQIDETIGRCAAELYWSDPGSETIEVLGEAVAHLNRALTFARPELPAVPRADLLDTLSRCRREVARRHEDEAERTQARLEADRAARAAIRELARCVLLAPDTDAALTIAARANDIVARCIGWSLADGNQRAALELAESGRGLVLASVTTAGQVEEVLRGAGEDDLADGWRHGGERGRIAALDAFWKPELNARLLTPPTSDEISVMLAATRADALVYLVPPEVRDGERPPGHAILMRPLTGVIEVVELPGLGDADRAPLDTYLAALKDAVDGFDSSATNPDGFRSGSAGGRWADALVQLGSWTYDQVMGPLIEHVRGWNLGRRPNLTLIPLGELAAIPYATAWTGDAGPEGSGSRRRYAIEAVVLSYAASARLLGEISRRPRQALNDRVVIVTDPTGMFAMSQITARLLAGNIYPRAEVYGRKTARNGAATTEALLNALPAADRPGASLLHLATHGTTDPVPQLQTKDGWLTLNRILDQARGRAPDAPGGLVITSACLTDSTRANYDESLTLATAFLAAGACSVIGTRWPVDDDMTAALSIRLHYHLQMGLPSGEALRQAQLDLIRPTAEIRKSLGRILETVEPERLSHPASWAGYVQHGSDNRKTT